MNIYFDLFFTFAKIGACTFGGGMAMLPILQREVVEKKGWATEEAMIASSVLKLAKSNLKDAVSICIFLVCIVLAFFTGVSPVVLVVCAGTTGYVAWTLAERKGEGE